MFAPGAHFVHTGGPRWFTPGEAASPGIERLAEDGDVTLALAELSSRSDTAGVFGADNGNISYDDSPIHPGGSADLITFGSPGDRLEFGMMWAQSNDVFVATEPGGIELFDGPVLRVGRITTLSLWDAGTEVNQEPGLGDAQAARQPAPDTGAAEGGVIQKLTDYRDAMGFTYPSLDDTLEATLETY